VTWTMTVTMNRLPGEWLAKVYITRPPQIPE